MGGVAKNHQVVAIGYETGPDGRVNIDLYDPNHPGMTPRLSFQPGGTTNRINARYGEALDVWQERIVTYVGHRDEQTGQLAKYLDGLKKAYAKF